MNSFQKKLLQIIILQTAIATVTAINIKTYINPEYSILIFLLISILLNTTFLFHARKPPQFLSIGYANYITLFRGLCLTVMSGYIFTAYTVVPIALYMIVISLDLVDGYVARKTDSVSKFGEKIDIECDAMGMLIAVILLLQYQKIPEIYLIVGIIRYLFVAHTYISQKKSPLLPLPKSNYRRYIAGLHMVFITVAFFLPAEIVYASSYIFLIPFLVTFLRDWLCVLGTIDPHSKVYQKIHQINYTVMFQLLPLIASISIFTQSLFYFTAFVFLTFSQKWNINKQTISVLTFATCAFFALEYNQTHSIVFSSIFIVTLGSKIRE